MTNGDVERRVRRLEWWNGVLVLALVVVGGSLGWRRAPSDVVRADRVDGTALYLRDGDGTTRVGVAQFAHGGGGFALHGPEAKGAAVQARYPGG